MACDIAHAREKVRVAWSRFLGQIKVEEPPERYPESPIDTYYYEDLLASSTNQTPEERESPDALRDAPPARGSNIFSDAGSMRSGYARRLDAERRRGPLGGEGPADARPRVLSRGSTHLLFIPTSHVTSAHTPAHRTARPPASTARCSTRGSPCRRRSGCRVPWVRARFEHRARSSSPKPLALQSALSVAAQIHACSRSRARSARPPPVLAMRQAKRSRRAARHDQTDAAWVRNCMVLKGHAPVAAQGARAAQGRRRQREEARPRSDAQHGEQDAPHGAEAQAEADVFPRARGLPRLQKMVAARWREGASTTTTTGVDGGARGAAGKMRHLRAPPPPPQASHEAPRGAPPTTEGRSAAALPRWQRRCCSAAAAAGNGAHVPRRRGIARRVLLLLAAARRQFPAMARGARAHPPERLRRARAQLDQGPPQKRVGVEHGGVDAPRAGRTRAQVGAAGGERPRERAQQRAASAAASSAGEPATNRRSQTRNVVSVGSAPTKARSSHCCETSCSWKP